MEETSGSCYVAVSEGRVASWLGNEYKLSDGTRILVTGIKYNDRAGWMIECDAYSQYGKVKRIHAAGFIGKFI